MVDIHKVKKMGIKLVLHKIIFRVDKKIQAIQDKFKIPFNVQLADKVVKRNIYNRCRWDNMYHESLNDNEKEKKLLIEQRYFWLGLKGDTVPEDVWNMDFISGYIWENAYFQNIKTVDLTKKSDVKVPWELSRLQYLYVFAENYMLSGEHTNIEYIKQMLKSWNDKNPYKHSVNWTCSMEVAIRAINIIFVLQMLSDELLDTEEDKQMILTLLYSHGKYIYGNLECYDKYNNNHYLSDLLGLLWIGFFLSDYTTGKTLKECNKWVKFANKEFEKEIAIQINEDGTDFESSIAYHRLVAEILLLYAYINKYYENHIKDSIYESINKVLNFLVEIRKPNGSLPMIGDADDGRILILEKYSSWDKRSCDFLLERKSQYLAGDFSNSKDIIPEISNVSICFENGGYYLLRNTSWYCMIHCGPLSMRGHGGHSHNDQLAVILSSGGKDFLVDPGVGCYSGNAELRNRLRSTEAHSTLQVIGMEQNQLIPERLFEMPEKTFSKCISFNGKMFCGQHYGYSEYGIIHKRSINMTETELVIVDYIEMADAEGTIAGDTEWVLNFILDSEVVVKRTSENSVDLYNGDVCVCMCCDLNIEVEEMDVSYSYGMTVKSNRLKTVASNKRKITTKFELLSKKETISE